MRRTKTTAPFPHRVTIIFSMIAIAVAIVSGTAALLRTSSPQRGQGGAGGNASSITGPAFGGPGGTSGDCGTGGRGGDAHSDTGPAFAGPGGDAGTKDHPARGGRVAWEKLGYPNRKLDDGTWLWERGIGGDAQSPCP